MDPLSDEKILSSWHANATPWTAAVREQRIESRRLVTDRAVVDAVLSRNPRSVLDLGCGEGWLVRALAKAGVARVIGVDAVPALVDQARAAGGGEFHVATYEAIARGELDGGGDGCRQCQADGRVGGCADGWRAGTVLCADGPVEPGDGKRERGYGRWNPRRGFDEDDEGETLGNHQPR